MGILIRRGRLVDPVSGIGGVLDILVENGKIAVIGSDLSAPDSQVIDAAGLTVCAGLVDLHAHLMEPGFEYRETIASGARAAAAGGFTSIACMPDTIPPIDVPGGIAYIKKAGSQAGGARVIPVAALSKGRQGQEPWNYEELKSAGAAALSDAAPIRNANLLRDAMILAHRQGLTVLSCCEDPDLGQNFSINEGRVSRQLRIPGRPAIAEELYVMREAMLAEETGAAVHICRISTAKSVSIEVLQQGPPARLDPPLRTPADVDGILEGLKDGTIDAIASGHSPLAEVETSRPLVQVPAGISALETTLASSLTALYHTGEMNLSDILRKLTINPAHILRLPNAGRLAIGLDADLIVFDPDEEWVVIPKNFYSFGQNTPFAGKVLKGKVKYTMVGGKFVHQSN